MRAQIALGVLVAMCCACAQPPTDPGTFFQLTPESAQHRAAQTREFETRDETELLSASAAVLQDLGFQVSESVREVGFLRAAKERGAREYGQEIQRGIVFVLSLALSAAGQSNATQVIPVDLHQQINASLVTRPIAADGSRYEVRVLFYRLVWKSDGQNGDQHIPAGQQKMEMIRDPLIYQQFFARLSKAVFLEAHKI
ncbi:MAG: hypothetical protein AAF430_13680 [Myxococcota bacterium]